MEIRQNPPNSEETVHFWQPFWQPFGAFWVVTLPLLHRFLDPLTLILSPTCKSTWEERTTESIETKSAAGKMLFSILGSFAEFERELIRERTKTGLENAKRHGRTSGRPQKLSAAQKEEMVKMLRDPDRTGNQIAAIFNVSSAYVSRLRKKMDVSEAA